MQDAARWFRRHEEQDPPPPMPSDAKERLRKAIQSDTSAVHHE